MSTDDANLKITLAGPGHWTIELRQTPEVRKALGKRYHDVTSAVRTLRFAFEALQNGYKFDDDMREAKLKAMERALVALENEVPLLQKLFSP